MALHDRMLQVLGCPGWPCSPSGSTREGQRHRAALPPSARRSLTGWGRTAPSACDVTEVRTAEDLDVVLSAAARSKRSVVARGLGRSYGDAAQCAGGVVIDITGLDAVLDADLDTGLVRVGAGTSLDALMRALVPRGWFVPVTPGTRHVTVGGAIAADIHGKNHHRDGSFCSYVTRLSLATPSGRRRGLARERPRPVLGHRRRHGPDRDRGRGHRADAPCRDRHHAGRHRAGPEPRRLHGPDDRARRRVPVLGGLDRLPGPGREDGSGRAHPGRPRPASRTSSRPDAPTRSPSTPWCAPRCRSRRRSGLLNPVTVAAFNELWFRKAPRRRVGELETIGDLLPPPRRRRVLEPALRTPGVPPVPVRGPLGRRGRPARRPRPA